MKKIRFIAYAGAIALLSTGFASCASNDEIADQNPTYDPVEKTVTTKFVLNIASGEMQETRQSAATVQRDFNDADPARKNFRGMQDAKLIGLSTGKTYSSTNPTHWLAPFASSSSGYDVIKTYDLGTLYGSTAVNNQHDDDENKTASSHRIVELTLPLATDAMLVYGRAIPSTDNEENGKVVYAVNATPENTTFSLVSRLGDNSDAYSQTCNLAALILNRIMLSNVASHAVTNAITRTSTTTGDSYTQKADLPALTWKELGTKEPSQIAALTPLQENLAIAYKTIQDTYSNSSAVHSGSAKAVCSVIKDIYSIASSVAQATATSDDELNAQRLADVIVTRIGYYFNINSDPYTFHNLGEAGTDGSVKKYLIDNAGLTSLDFASGGQFGKVTDSYIQGFPVVFKLPEGVAQLEFVAFNETGTTGGFKYKPVSGTTGSESLIELGTRLDATKYMYPSELLYFDNSLLRVNDADKEPDQYPDGYGNWENDNHTLWSGWEIGPVASTTRSVAVKNNINYGVAMLQTYVDLADGDAFSDNRPEDENVTLTAAEVKRFTLTGVLIGGQYKQLGWNYLADANATNNDNYVIYDNKIVSGTIPTTSPNYTLVFDNYAGTSPESDVRIALEFKNGNDKDVYGIGGMIPKGGTFYLVGQLKLAEATNTITWPTKYAIPPYNTNGESKEIERIFIQDYMTTARFIIGPNSLKNAYTTVPDLRASQTSLGLSVDLNWRPGLSFEATLGQ